jgi:hypothetical protein
VREAYRAALIRAAEAVGGELELATALGVSSSKLDRWIRELEPMPDAVFLKIVDLLEAFELSRLAAKDQGGNPR